MTEQKQVLYTAYATAPSGLNMRSEPNLNADKLELLPFGCEVKVYHEYAGWLYVEATGQQGWIYAGYTSRSKPVQQESGGSDLDAAIERLAAKYNLDPKLARAVMRVESAGRGIINGKVLARFEPRVWLTSECPAELRDVGRMLFAYGSRPQDDRMSLTGTWKEFHGNQSLEHLAISVASAVDRESAIRSASFGLAQVMGFNAKLVGYQSTEQMVDLFSRSEEAQAAAFFEYCDKRRDSQGSALDALRNGDLIRFARMYNGIGQEQLYASLIQQALA